MACEKCDLTKAIGEGTVREGAGGPQGGGNPRKTRRANGPAGASLTDLLLRLHTFARDAAQLAKESDMSSYELHASFLFELAELLKEEYDKRHGK